MAAISYEYNSFEFKRPPLDPFTEEEYRLARNDFENFLGDILEKAEEEFKKLKNPHRFRWKLFLILLGAGIVLEGTDQVLKALGYYDAGETFAMISFLPFFAVVIQPVQWLLSFTKSSPFTSYEKDARTYYCFHYSKIKATADYTAYKKLVATTTIGEYARFIWDE